MRRKWKGKRLPVSPIDLARVTVDIRKREREAYQAPLEKRKERRAAFAAALRKGPTSLRGVLVSILAGDYGAMYASAANAAANWPSTSGRRGKRAFYLAALLHWSVPYRHAKDELRRLPRAQQMRILVHLEAVLNAWKGTYGETYKKAKEIENCQWRW